MELLEKELLPCPFCGGYPNISQVKDFVNSTQHKDVFLYRVACLTENCPIKPKTLQYNYRDSAVKTWNTRAPKTEWVSVEGDKYAVVTWVNGNPCLDGMPYFNSKDEALVHAEKLESYPIPFGMEVGYTIIRLEKTPSPPVK